MFQIRTERLLLRPLCRDDAVDMARYCSDLDVARMTVAIPHPYTIDDAIGFIERPNEAGVFAICYEGKFAGAIGYRTHAQGGDGIGYWLGKPFWGVGIATEAARAVLVHMVRTMKLDKITTGYFKDNPASGRVLQKCGFRSSGSRKLNCRARGGEVDALELEFDKARADYLEGARVPAERYEPWLTTRRLALRPLRDQDLSQLFRQANDPETARQTASYRYPMSASHMRRKMRAMADRTGHLFAICPKGNPDQLFGTIEAGWMGAGRRVGIGYGIARPFRRRGYLGEALGQIVNYAFAGLRAEEAYAECRLQNEASRRALERAGFRFSGRSTVRSRQLGRRVPTMIYRLSRSDWQARGRSES